MPIYTYKCRACGHEFEHWQRSLKNPDEVSCPKCQAKDVERVFRPGGQIGIRIH